MTTDGKLRIGLIGAGGIACNVHLPCLREIPQVELAAVCDIRPDRAQAAAATFAIPNSYTLYREMLDRESLDAVYVLTEPDQLFRPAKACLDAGLHVFLEKPPGVTTYQARTLLHAARQAGRVCMVGLNRRYMPVVQEVLARLKGQGPIHQVDAQFIKHGGADFYDGCASAFECDTIHIIDLVGWIAGAPPQAAAMVQGRYGHQVADAWNGLVRFANGVTGTIRANYQSGGRVQTLEVHGPGGSAFVDLGFGEATCSARMLLFDGEGTHSLTANGPGKTRQVELDGKKLAGSEEFRVYYGYAAQAREFVECVLQGRRPLTDIEEGVKSMELADLLRASTI